MPGRKYPFKQGVARILKYEKIRFGLVGIVNTVTDFAIFLALSIGAGLPASVSNIVSTSCAMAVSFLLNKKAVFGNSEKINGRQIVTFLVVTLTGLWIVQTAIIVNANIAFQALLPGTPDIVTLTVAKILATIASLIWNYLWYSRLVFKKSDSN